MTVATQKAVDRLNSMLRGELSAVETYEQALEHAGDAPQASQLRAILSDHREAASTIRSHILSMQGEPEEGSGAWGVWANVVMGSARLFGDNATLKALKEGEEHGQNDYQSFLDHEDAPDVCKTFVRTVLLPRQSEHIATLDSLMEGTQAPRPR